MTGQRKGLTRQHKDLTRRHKDLTSHYELQLGVGSSFSTWKHGYIREDCYTVDFPHSRVTPCLCLVFILENFLSE